MADNPSTRPRPSYQTLRVRVFENIKRSQKQTGGRGGGREEEEEEGWGGDEGFSAEVLM